MSAFFFVLFILIITSLNWFVVNSMFEAHHFKLDDHYGELGNSISDEENFLSPFPTGHEIRDINLLRRYKSLPDLIVALSAGHGGVIEKPQIRYPDPKKLIFTLQKTHNVKTPDPKLMLTKMLENMLKNSSLDEEKSLIANDVSVNYTRKTDKKLVLGNKEKTSDVDKKLKDILIQYGLSEPDVDVDVSNTIDHKIIIEESEEETDDPTASDQVMVDYIKNIDKTISFEGDDDDDEEEDEDDYIKHNQINGSSIKDIKVKEDEKRKESTTIMNEVDAYGTENVISEEELNEIVHEYVNGTYPKSWLEKTKDFFMDTIKRLPFFKCHFNSLFQFHCHM